LEYKGVVRRKREPMNHRAVNGKTETSKADGQFRKSSFSSSGGCVEVAMYVDGAVQVRDTKNRQGGTLTFNATEWDAFLKGVRNGEFDLV